MYTATLFSLFQLHCSHELANTMSLVLTIFLFTVVFVQDARFMSPTPLTPRPKAEMRAKRASLSKCTFSSAGKPCQSKSVVMENYDVPAHFYIDDIDDVL